MSNNKSNRRRLVYSVISLILCISMLLGTTLAWFTDSVSSTGNIIKSGKLDVAMHYAEHKDGEWKDASDAAIFDGGIWEPGYSEMKFIRVSNTGNLAFSYQMHILPAVEAEGDVDLAEVIDVYVGLVDDNFTEPAAFSTQMEGMTKVDTLAELMDKDAAMEGILLPTKGAAGVLPDGVSADTGDVTFCVVLHMQEDAGNKYQDLTVGNNFSIQLVATQYDYEKDGFGGGYDINSEWPYVNIKYSVWESIADKVDPETNCLTEDVMIGLTSEDQYALIPAGVKVVEGADKLVFSIDAIADPSADVTKTSRDEILRSIDVHVDGVAEDNTVPMTFVLKELFPVALNSSSVKLYHVEAGETKEMTIVDAPVNHNEFSYDPLTGDAVLTLASFSEVATYADTNDGWQGDAATKFSSGTGTEADPYIIANAGEFAYFRNQVDAGNDFDGKFIKLLGNINLNNVNFDPIGWGYENPAWNKGGAKGKVFKGTFDGDGHIIYGLKQDGWDLTMPDGNAYTYTNCGFGLFAAACDATFQNLTIDGADIRVECVETGVLVGLAQGNCIFNKINILGCKAANYQRPVGGVVGEVSPNVNAEKSVHTFTDVYVDSNTVIGSLWGDFDAPVGGVIGAYWDDEGKTSVDMNNVTVACELDVYNDVTSTYQWYAYRRAGMLIGNTDRSETDANGRTVASTKINGTDFLTCTDVTVYYGAWADYHYCEFNKANPNWPWVRVEPGENCEGYSNPRWGRPIDSTTGQPVTDSVHEHGENEGHLQSIPFKQLYGGGQGVYGAETHPNVSEGIYTVTYMDHGKILHVDNVTDNNVAYDCSHVDGTGIWPITKVKDANNNTPSYWVKPDNSKFEGVGVGNTANVIVYPKWPNEYAVRCLDTYGDVAYYNFVTDDNTTDAEYEAIATEINNTLVNIQNEVDKDKKVMIIKWKLVDGDTNDSNDVIYNEEITASIIKGIVNPEKGSGKDFILEAVPQLQNTSITLVPYNDPTTGELVAYHVAEVNKNDTNSHVVIPDYVGKIRITEIRQDAAAGFANLHSITIPSTVTLLGENSFADGNSFGNGETITIYFEGTKDQWDAITNNSPGWSKGIGTGSRIFFLKNGKVDTTQVYLEAIGEGGFIGIGTKYSWSEKTVDNQLINDYLGYCDCKATTTGDTSHTYVDANDNVMGRNEAGTPISTSGNVITFKEGSWGRADKLTDGSVDTYKRYRPDKAYWEGVTVS